MQRNPLWPALAALIATGCASEPRYADTPVGAPRLIELPVAEHDRVLIRIPAGDVRIVGTGGDRLRGELILKCPDATGRCARRLSEVEFVGLVKPGAVDLRLTHDRSYRYRDGSLKAVIEVPRARELEVRMTAGDLEIDRVDACLTVHMGAGDVGIRAPADRVARVKLDAGVGDAGLTAGGRHIEAPRSWLIGAELDWGPGAGACDMVVDLRAGDIDVSLVD